MNKKAKSKLIPILVILILLFSINTFIQTPVADVWPDGTNGSALGLTPGDNITYKITDNTLNASENYTVWICGIKWIQIGNDSSDDKINAGLTGLYFYAGAGYIF